MKFVRDGNGGLGVEGIWLQILSACGFDSNRKVALTLRVLVHPFSIVFA